MKLADSLTARLPGAGPSRGSVGSSRDAIARLVLERGPQTAAALAAELDMTPAGVRRHLDALLADGLLAETAPRRTAQRGRGRPARVYALTDTGRSAFPHAYDDLATTALRYLRSSGGDDAVIAFADHRAAALERMLAPAVGPEADSAQRTAQLSRALTEQGYAASTESTAAAEPGGVQLCQHHCPVAHVAAEFPELCEAETRAFERVLGTYVQRLATIGHGDGVCTTYVPAPPQRSVGADQDDRHTTKLPPTLGRSSTKAPVRAGRDAADSEGAS